MVPAVWCKEFKELAVAESDASEFTRAAVETIDAEHLTAKVFDERGCYR